MWTTIIDRMLRKLVRTGTLVVHWPDGQVSHYGDGSGFAVSVTVHDPSVIKALCLSPELALGEGYMDGRLTIADDRVDQLLRLLIRNQPDRNMPPWIKTAAGARRALRSWLLRNSPQSAQRNVAHHYDISDDLYRIFLDEDMQYSCAYFTRPDMGLEEAQRAKKHHIAHKLCLEPGMHVLDIGCGWGGMALTLARDYNVRVTGVTLSENQLATARRRAEEAGLSDRVDFQLRDYRSLTERFDRIVSVGMFEHVGPAHYAEYFGQIERLLAEDGVALVHTIAYSRAPKAQSPWILKYIFPGGHVPALSEMATALEQTGLWQTDFEILRLHYAETLLYWRHRFEAHLDEVRAMYDETFIRMWRFYLAACEMAFRESRQAVMQVQLAKRIDAVPLSRDYLYATPHKKTRMAAE